jgi:hypothetical protein
MFAKPPPPAPRYTVGLDLDPAAEFSALAVAERRPAEGRARPAYTVNYLRRWPLGTPYPDIVADVTALVRRKRLDQPDLAVD